MEELNDQLKTLGKPPVSSFKDLKDGTILAGLASQKLGTTLIGIRKPPCTIPDMIHNWSVILSEFPSIESPPELAVKSASVAGV